MDDVLNHQYLADRAVALGAGVVLDFGCGKAGAVQLMRSQGVEAFGADVFWGGMTWAGNDGPYRELLKTGVVREIVEGAIPFPDASFDVIVSDQVLEHVQNLGQSIAEMARVLKPSGKMYHQYPPRDILLEPHTKIPLAHRLPRQIRTPWLKAWRSLGAGRHPLHIDGPREWAEFGAQWIDDYCVYRPRTVVEGIFRDHGYTIAHREAENCLFRAKRHRLLAATIGASPTAAAAAFRALGSDCIEVTTAGPVDQLE